MNKKQLSFCLLSAILLTLSWPTRGISFLIFFSLVPILIIENEIRHDTLKHKKIRFFLFSYLTFLLWNIGTTWWIVNSTVIGMLFANMLNALFFTLLLQFFYWAKSILNLRLSYIFLVCLWICFEKLHLHWDLSWPWLNLGNVFSESIAIIQWYEFTGTFGGTLWILVVNILLFQSIKDHQWSNPERKSLKRIAIPLAIVLIPCLISLIQFYNIPQKKKNIQVLLLQPNIDSYSEKYNMNNEDFVVLLDSLTNNKLSKEYHYIITPETYFSHGIGENIDQFTSTVLYQDLIKLLRENQNIQLLAGMQLYQVYRSQNQPTNTSNFIEEGIWVDYYNSAVSISSNQPPEYYHKSKLVVGVENLPFKEILRPLLGDALIDFGGTVASRATQDSRTVFLHPKIDVKTAPIICYESIYGEFVTGYVRNGATLLTVLTNDSWWGKTPGHRQLLSYTRLRAIETRRDIVRSANTGISAFINTKGQITTRLGYEKQGILIGTASSNDYKTFYVRFGDYIYRCAGLILILITLHLVSLKFKRLFGRDS